MSETQQQGKVEMLFPKGNTLFLYDIPHNFNICLQSPAFSL